MPDMMMFPKTVDEFMEQYKIVDTDEIYTNGEELVPIFRMKQWFEHVDAVEIVRCKDCRWCHAGYCERADDLIPFGFAHYEWENFYCAWAERRQDADK